MKKIVIINRTVWVGGVVRRPGDVLEVPDGVAGDMCGALKTGRLWDPVKDAPPLSPALPPQADSPKKSGKKNTGE